MLENEDIQHILLTRTPALTGRYEFLSFRNAAGGRAWLSAIREKAQSAAEVMASVEKDKRWVTLAFTWNGLRALGGDEDSLATFPEEFKQGMVARAEMLGDSGENHPENWVGGLASPDLHAIAILFARDATEGGRCQLEHGKTHEEQELIAAKLMGRWRSGAPLTLAPEKDDPALGADLQRNNDFNYKEMDPHGYAVPLGSHMRRMNPRDTAANMNRRRMIRRGATYGPHLPERTPEDGQERGT